MNSSVVDTTLNLYLTANQLLTFTAHTLLDGQSMEGRHNTLTHINRKPIVYINYFIFII